jgi:uncharacterized protein YjeT (DUF2065 family)
LSGYTVYRLPNLVIRLKNPITIWICSKFYGGFFWCHPPFSHHFYNFLQNKNKYLTNPIYTKHDFPIFCNRAILSIIKWRLKMGGGYIFIGYLGALVFALAQIGLALFLIISGIINVFFYAKDNIWLKRFGLVTQVPDDQRNQIGIAKVVLGLVLFFPYLFGIHYLVSFLACVVALVLFIYLERQNDRENRQCGLLMRYLVVFLAVVSLGANIYEERDAMELANSLVTKVIKYRTIETTWQKQQNRIVPKIGERATDFEVTSYDNTHTIRLSDFRGEKPVALLFGSYT